MTTTDTSTLTERERLALAMDELHRTHGYWVPDPADLEPGPSMALEDTPDDKPYVTWHSQTEEAYGTLDCTTCHAYVAASMLDDPDGLDCYTDETIDMARRLALLPDDEQRAAERAHILADHGDLHHEMNLMWGDATDPPFTPADPNLICTVLRRYGLDAREPEDPRTCIAVLPSDRRRWPHWATHHETEKSCFMGHHHGYKPPESVNDDDPTLFDDDDCGHEP